MLLSRLGQSIDSASSTPRTNCATLLQHAQPATVSGPSLLLSGSPDFEDGDMTDDHVPHLRIVSTGMDVAPIVDEAGHLLPQ